MDSPKLWLKVGIFLLILNIVVWIYAKNKRSKLPLISEDGTVVYLRPPDSHMGLALFCGIGAPVVFIVVCTYETEYSLFMSVFMTLCSVMTILITIAIADECIEIEKGADTFALVLLGSREIYNYNNITNIQYVEDTDGINRIKTFGDYFRIHLGKKKVDIHVELMNFDVFWLELDRRGLIEKFDVRRTEYYKYEFSPDDLDPMKNVPDRENLILDLEDVRKNFLEKDSDKPTEISSDAENL